MVPLTTWHISQSVQLILVQIATIKFLHSSLALITYKTIFYHSHISYNAILHGATYNLANLTISKKICALVLLSGKTHILVLNHALCDIQNRSIEVKKCKTATVDNCNSLPILVLAQCSIPKNNLDYCFVHVIHLCFIMNTCKV